MEEFIPLRENISKPLRETIHKLLQKYGGADDYTEFNWSLMSFVLQDGVAKYIQTLVGIFGEQINLSVNSTYYPLCMLCYYDKSQDIKNSALFKYKEGTKCESLDFPTEKEIMKWFYLKHRDELVGLVDFKLINE
jgi:hypothetical protein